MDAMMHAYSVGRELGLDDQSKPDLIWDPSAKVVERRMTAKSARVERPPAW
jgi:hypothetical protein